MQMFFVTSGDMEHQVVAKDARTAAKEAIRQAAPDDLGMLVEVSTHGFCEKPHDDDIFFMTENLLKEIPELKFTIEDSDGR